MDLGQKPSDLELTVFCQLLYDAVRLLLTSLPLSPAERRGVSSSTLDNFPCPLLYPAENSLQVDKAALLKLTGFSG